MTDDKIGNSIKITREAIAEAPIRNYLGLSPIKTEGESCLFDKDSVAPKKKIKSKKKLRKKIAKLEAELKNKELYRDMWHKARAYAEGLEEAMRPFAEFIYSDGPELDDGSIEVSLSVEDLRAARAALDGK